MMEVSRSPWAVPSLGDGIGAACAAEHSRSALVSADGMALRAVLSCADGAWSEPAEGAGVDEGAGDGAATGASWR